MQSRSTLRALAVAALVLSPGRGGPARAAESRSAVDVPVASTPLPSGAPDAILDLGTRAGARSAGGPWRFCGASLVEVDFRSPGPDRKPSGPPNRTYDIAPHAEGRDFDDTTWEALDPTTLDARRSTGKVCFAWYRFRIVVPDRVGQFDPTGATIVFETVVDDYAEVWVDGTLPRELGQVGGTVVAGFNAPNRLVVGRDVKPGQVIQLALFTMNGPVSVAPENFIWMRRARLDFYADRSPDAAVTVPPSVGRIERLDPRFDKLVARDAHIERVVDGFTWVEGPVWDRERQRLLFSDIPNNAVYSWSDRGVELVLRPSGYTGGAAFTGREPGSNGLLFDAAGKLLLCQHGDRRVARLEDNGSFTTVLGMYAGKRLNSPNDVVLAANGDLYCTDPPFGLPRAFDDPAKEQPGSGVYRLRASGEVELLTDALRAPNGIALSPDGKTLVISNADAVHPVWLAYPRRPDGTLGLGRVFADATPFVAGRRGLPDGMKFDRKGNLFAAGPEGIYVFASDGTLLGRFDLGVPTSNCAWGEDGASLFITADTAIYRVRLRTRGPETDTVLLSGRDRGMR
jgi:gluconolactonase